MKQILNTFYVQTQGTYLHLDLDTLKVAPGLERIGTFLSSAS